MLLIRMVVFAALVLPVLGLTATAGTAGRGQPCPHRGDGSGGFSPDRAVAGNVRSLPDDPRRG